MAPDCSDPIRRLNEAHRRQLWNLLKLCTHVNGPIMFRNPQQDLYCR